MPSFRAITDYDEQAYRALVHITMKHLRRWPRILLMATGTVSVLLPGAYMVSTGQTSFLLVLLVFTGNLAMLAGVFAPRIATRMLVANNIRGEAPVVRFRFHQGAMQVENQEGVREYSYRDVQRVFDALGYLVFFFRDKRVDMLRQEDLEGGSPESFRSFLNTRLSGGAHELGAADRQQV